MSGDIRLCVIPYFPTERFVCEKKIAHIIRYCFQQLIVVSFHGGKRQEVHTPHPAEKGHTRTCTVCDILCRKPLLYASCFAPKYLHVHIYIYLHIRIWFRTRLCMFLLVCVCVCVRSSFHFFCISTFVAS